jgi:hypothetical protein
MALHRGGVMPYPFDDGAVRQSSSDPVRIRRVRDDIEVVNGVVTIALSDVRQRFQDARDQLMADVAAARTVVNALAADAAQARGAFATLNLRLTAIENRLTAVEARLPPIP